VDQYCWKREEQLSANKSRYFGFTKLVFIIERFFMISLRYIVIMIPIVDGLDVESNFITVGWPINGQRQSCRSAASHDYPSGKELRRVATLLKSLPSFGD